MAASGGGLTARTMKPNTRSAILTTIAAIVNFASPWPAASPRTIFAALHN